MDPTLLLQLLANGLFVGLGYGLAAIGLALIFGILDQVNFAHGEIYTIGAFALWYGAEQAGLSYWLAAPVVVLFTAAAGVLLARGVLIPTINRSFEAVILATLAVSIIVQNLVRLVFGATPRHVPTPIESVVMEAGGILVFGQRLLAAGVAIAAIAGLVAFLRATETGRAMRAAAQSKEACLMVGIDIRAVTIVSAALGAGLCGLAAVAIAPTFDLYPNMGTDVAFKSFAVIIIGGMGNVAGAVVAGLLLGIAESVAGGIIGAAFRDGIGFTLMIAMLLLRPNGLFGRSVRV